MARFRAHGGVAPGEQLRCELDLSVCINPFGPTAVIREAIATADIARYPDPASTLGRRALADWLGCSIDSLALGNGAAELLWTLSRVALGPGCKALLWQPCFSEFEAAALAASASVVHFELPPGIEAHGERALDALSTCMTRELPQVLYLCAPQSPLGSYVSPEVYCEIARRFPDTLVLVDQSYLGLSKHAEELTLPSTLPGQRNLDNLVLVRSLTKELGTPGVRVGYMLASRALVTAVTSKRPAWTVSAAAEAAVRAYPSQLPAIATHRSELLRLAGELFAGLVQAGCRPFATDTLYCVAHVPPLFTYAAEFRQRLIDRHQLAVRDCASFGLPDCFRVAAHPEQAKLLAAIARMEGQL